MSSPPQCQSYKSLKETHIRCPHKAKPPYNKYCGIHKTCQVDKINFTISKPKPPTPSTSTQIIDISHMNMRVSYHKLPFDIVKSGLQKSIRRGCLHEAIAYGIEGDLFSLVEEEGHIKGNRTNLANRLRIILVEDLFDWQSVVKAETWFKMWERKRKTPESRRYLLSIIRRLANAKKIRLINDLKVYMFRDNYRKLLGTDYDELFTGLHDYINPNPEVEPTPINRFKFLLENHNPNCLYWYNELHKNNHSDSCVWNIINDVAKNAENYNLLHTIQALFNLQSQLGTKHHEYYLYTMSAIAFILYEKQINWSPMPISNDLMTTVDADKLYKRHQAIPIANLPYRKTGWLPEDIVADKHTALGRANGKTALDFVKKGCLVTNEDETFYFPILREIYLKKKIADENPSLS